MSKAVANVLDKARQRMIEKGWIKGATDDGRSCALRALGASSRNPRLVDAAANALRRVTKCTFVWKWNDAPERTKAQVLGAFKRAANAERKTK